MDQLYICLRHRGWNNKSRSRFPRGSGVVVLEPEVTGSQSVVTVTMKSIINGEIWVVENQTPWSNRSVDIESTPLEYSSAVSSHP